MNFNIASLKQFALTTLADLGLKILGAFALWIIGRWLIHIATNMIGRVLGRQKLDSTLTRWIQNTTGAVLNIALVVAVLGYFGVQTTTFAALIAAGGIAIGMAWSGLLSNFAAGVFLVILQPFKVGDFVVAGGVTGTVDEVGLFVSIINTPDNVRTFVGNTKIFSDNIQNFSTNAFRRVDLTAQLAHTVAPQDAIARLKAGMANIPNILTSPAPDVEILTFNLAGPVLAVRPYCNNQHYWQVYFETNRLIRDCFGQAGYPVPDQHYTLHASPAEHAAILGDSLAAKA
jgi:small conductance mechanosensitive channel